MKRSLLPFFFFPSPSHRFLPVMMTDNFLSFLFFFLLIGSCQSMWQTATTISHQVFFSRPEIGVGGGGGVSWCYMPNQPVRLYQGGGGGGGGGWGRGRKNVFSESWTLSILFLHFLFHINSKQSFTENVCVHARRRWITGLCEHCCYVFFLNMNIYWPVPWQHQW